jgi:vitamin B12 transporter
MTSIRAQDAIQISEAELPAVVVEGATLEAKPAVAPKVRKKTAPVQANNPPPAPKKANKSAKKSSGGGSQGAPAAAAEASDFEDSETLDTTAANGAGAFEANGVTGIPADKLGTSVSVVTGAELKARQVRTAADALRSLPGVSVSQQGGTQNQTVVRLRGAESNHTLVLIDGVEVNSPGTDGFFDFANLLVDDIAQIEVLRGPQSGLYSSGALGGVINIITNRGKGPLTFRARAEGGSFDTRDGMVGLSGGTDRAHASITLSGRRTNGFDISDDGTEDDGGEFRNLSFTGGVLVFDHLKIDASLRSSRREGDRDGTNGVRDGFSVASEEASTFASDLWLGRLEATLDTFDGDWIHKVFINGSEQDIRDLDRGIFSPPTGLASRQVASVTKYGYLSTYKLESDAAPVRHFITGLVEHTREDFEQPLLTNEAFERTRDSIAGEIRGEYFNALTLTGNVRHDNNEGFEDATTWRAAGSLQPAGSPFRLHASVGTGIKYPSFSEQFGVFTGFVANPNLTPETSLGWDAGVEVTFLGGKGVIDVTYFNTNLENEIDFNFVPPVGACGGVAFCFIPFNRTGESQRDGIEVSGRLIIVDGLSVGAAYTYLDARESDGAEEVRRAPHSGRADLNYVFASGKGNFNLAAVYNGRMLDLAFSPITFTSQRLALDEYWLVTAAASYEVAPGVELFGRVENLLDQDYEEVFGYNPAGVAAYAGVRFTYEEPSTLDWSQYK